jgi:hypothetical protein
VRRPRHQARPRGSERGVVAEGPVGASWAGRLRIIPQMTQLVWGRDELGAGEMWNSNSMISWLIARTGLDVDSIKPPAWGRAPGWSAGVVLAARDSAVGSRRASRTSPLSTWVTAGILTPRGLSGQGAVLAKDRPSRCRKSTRNLREWTYS